MADRQADAAPTVLEPVLLGAARILHPGADLHPPVPVAQRQVVEPGRAVAVRRDVGARVGEIRHRPMRQADAQRALVGGHRDQRLGRIGARGTPFDGAGQQGGRRRQVHRLGGRRGSGRWPGASRAIRSHSGSASRRLSWLPGSSHQRRPRILGHRRERLAHDWQRRGWRVEGVAGDQYVRRAVGPRRSRDAPDRAVPGLSQPAADAAVGRLGDVGELGRRGAGRTCG